MLNILGGGQINPPSYSTNEINLILYNDINLILCFSFAVRTSNHNHTGWDEDDPTCG
jgi:hypothetical protein